MTEIKEIDTIPDEPTADRPENRRKKRQTTPFLKPRDGLLIAFFVPVLVMICIFVQDLSIRGEVLSENRYVSPVRPVLFGVPV